MRICSVESCDKPVRRWGYCPSHAGRFFRYGDPLAGGPPRKPRGLSEREAFEYYMPGAPPTGGCWDWTGGTLKSGGYGVVAFGGTQHRAHVVSYRIHHGPITSGMNVLHSCDRPICVHPDHLSLGPQKKNIQECVERDRHARGERNGHSKLTEENVLMVRSSPESNSALARELGVDPSTISQIRSRKLWKHI